MEDIIIREARPEDYKSFRKMEEKVWANSDVPVLSEEMFLAWIDVFPQGFMLAIKDGEVVGHIYAQVCDFDPKDETDERNLYEMTDNMWTRKTHNPNGNCIYSFSINSIHMGAAQKLNWYFIKLVEKLNKDYYGGPVRMPGLGEYMKKMQRKRLTKKFVKEYAQYAHDTIKGLRKEEPLVYDMVLTPLFKLPVAKFGKIIKNFFPYAKGAERWACVVYCDNLKYIK
ncbi:hypothetical protein A2331_03535 [Candidatus Falkowbacteria bacterium RIFOXYB2_FULL_34_18]|uniref:N-acetyltransferase domain-containing protein n=1 Tax=Candidatus Falkowbacteria bacterium RIFOXYD2_FULL_34_120 TaxID=1798007 RepID=A0A1F5TTB2_9BACT|nr:MAG: hypothetical protein A2331_03535 [Candidatus Falkowbacteria bacterium RIFOXYB2_FULL_34_18]OGF30106.1 MAG: hypothetical protein A2500_04915 [Candidatus Falkowbacteria bacterium RIFOXYC12_FULL_34_55]OGF37560.1 MAG: hypothetical protein A2466_01930 [Candidatus Falkowbacteria bacterium RIFOXYC2_FULL_34_220]OGF39316.1 MAG: hypothetical protein A2515_02345 [Candidatus Falkowbacteria bacterium RIFOXYD12_FULL_34_57]OGF41821.1 MAG: hypothetical protein A2531_05330 [Candidatus Falkowbacteria bact